jgi:hypothetical protein
MLAQANPLWILNENKRMQEPKDTIKSPACFQGLPCPFAIRNPQSAIRN